MSVALLKPDEAVHQLADKAGQIVLPGKCPGRNCPVREQTWKEFSFQGKEHLS